MIYKKNFVHSSHAFKSFFEQGLERNREAMKNMYKALKNMLARTTKRSNKQIDEEDNHEYWMRLKKNLPKATDFLPII